MCRIKKRSSMKFNLLRFTALTIFLQLFALETFAKEKEPVYAPSEAIVIYRSQGSSTLSTRGLKSIKSFKNLTTNKKGAVALVRGNLPAKQLIEKLKSDPNVIAAYPNYRRKLMRVPNDPSFSQLWGLNNTGQQVNYSSGTADADIDAPEAWEKSTGNHAIVVAVLDTGVDYTHEELADNIWRNSGEIPNNGIDDDGNGYIDDYYGYDFASDENGSNDSDPMDFMGHGTHVAGTIGAAGDNAKGIAGINWNVSIMALKVARPDGYLYDGDILEALDYILQMKRDGVDIVSVNASYGGNGGSSGDAVNTAIDALGNAGIIFVAAAGNESSDIDSSPSYPASYPSANIISVAATDQDDNPAGFSNTGAVSVDLAAPGTNIFSSLPGGDYLPANGDIFFDDMESNDSMWLHSGTNETWQITSEDVYSGSYAWSDSPSANYQPSADAFLTIKNPIDLTSLDPAADHLYLGFRAKFKIESGYDNLWIEISKDGGNSWHKIDAKSGSASYNYTWNLYRYTVPPSYWSADFMFRFHLKSDTDVQYDGVYIDDIGLGTAEPAGYDYYNGTSMATPHVTGTVALLYSIFPGKTAAEIKSRILNNVDPLASLSGKVATGGRLNLNTAATNHTPTALDDTVNTDENMSITINVLSNDTDPDGDILTLNAVTTPPGHANATITGNRILYVPQNGYKGDDSFVYEINDGSGGSATAKVTVSVGSTSSNSAPDAVDDSAEAESGRSKSIEVLLNDSDPDGDTLAILSVTKPAHGTAQIAGTVILYTPDSGYGGIDTFTYTISDGNGGTDTAQVTVTVNRGPKAVDDSAVTTEGSSVQIDVLSNDTDPDGDTLKIISVGNPAHGSAVINSNKITYTPNPGFTGSDTFDYVMADSKGGVDRAEVTVTVNAKPGGGSGGFDPLSLISAIAGFLLISYLSLGKGENR